MKHTKLAVSVLIATSLAACGGGGGGSVPAPVVTASVAPAPVPVVITPAAKLDPIKVKSTSYANAKEVGLGAETIPNVSIAGYTVLAYAFADFMQDGTLSLVTHSLAYDAGKPETKGAVGHVAFWKKVNGQWSNVTTTLLTDTKGCLHARKAVVADFNNDAKPDVFFACTGFDADPFTGEQQMMALSQPDGTYKMKTVPVTCYCHGASAAELNNKGYADVVVTDIATAKGSFMLINNKNDTFTQSYEGMPVSGQGKPIFTAELLDYDRDGKVDLFLAGIENATGATWAPTIFRNNGGNDFSFDKNPIVFKTDAVFNTTLDIVRDGDNTYLLRTPHDYMGTAIQKVGPNGVAEMIFQNTGYLNKEKNLVWVDWIVIKNDRVVSLNAMYGVSVNK
jgi:hypothetical protein